MHAFTVDCSDWEALSDYATHPNHTPISNQFLENAEGGVHSSVVVDIKVYHQCSHF
jgi:hypothetical protein